MPADRGFGALGHFRLEALDLAQHDVGAEQEIAAVPEIVVGDVAAAVAASGFSTKASTANAGPPLSFAPGRI